MANAVVARSERMSRLVDRKVLLTHVTHERVLNALGRHYRENPFYNSYYRLTSILFLFFLFFFLVLILEDG